MTFLHYLANNNAVGLWFQRPNGYKFRRGKATEKRLTLFR
jgi:hypothetical protein